jgi:rSAM/selenodomain-associated transferase 2
MTDVGLLSVVIPTLEETGRIGRLVEGLSREAGVEVIVADGGSRDGTPEIARHRGARVVECAPGRAVQMNAGAREASGDALLFLHADTRLPEGYDRLIRRALEDEGVAGGAFRLAFDGAGPFLRLIAGAANFRSRRMGITFGDQALFARTDLFRRIGGFPEQPIMEDYEFVRRLRRCGRVVLLPEELVTSARRWRRNGALRTTLLNHVITWAYLCGVSPRRLASWRRQQTGGPS